MPKRFREGLVFTADRLLYHSTLGLRVIKKKKKPKPAPPPRDANRGLLTTPTRGCVRKCKTPLSGEGALPPDGGAVHAGARAAAVARVHRVPAMRHLICYSQAYS